MDARQLRYFTAVVQERSFTRAAARLHMTQPPLSTSIAQLEKELGVTLLERNGRGVEPTEAGEHLVARATAILADLEDAATDVKAVGTGRQGHLSVAVAPGASWELLPGLLRRFDQSAPDVTIEILDASEPQTVDLVRSRVCDVGLAYCSKATSLERLVARDLEVAMVRRETVVAAVPVDSAMGEAESASFEDLAPHRWLAPVVYDGFPGVAQYVREAWERAGVAPVVGRRVGSMETALRLAQSGAGYALVPSSAGQVSTGSGVRMVRLAQHLAPIEAVVVWRRGERPSPVLNGFLRAALATLEPDRLSPAHERPGRADL
ncbi:LysR family transcriptional regulator [Solicola sp. PLA-1-18]|uniref:LysR family transcriptional regulator n=1 Tax=Solicola sp. PLA-1-18 TaxID=3380532 RepID=UPI003B801809